MHILFIRKNALQALIKRLHCSPRFFKKFSRPVMMSRRAGMHGAEPHQWLSNTTDRRASRSIFGVMAASLPAPYADSMRRLSVSHRMKMVFMLFLPVILTAVASRFSHIALPVHRFPASNDALNRSCAAPVSDPLSGVLA